MKQAAFRQEGNNNQIVSGVLLCVPFDTCYIKRFASSNIFSLRIGLESAMPYMFPTASGKRYCRHKFNSPQINAIGCSRPSDKDPTKTWR